jgi:hypothetical protein
LGVSRNNRLIERHSSPYGSYWRSYDFADNVGRRNLFAHPLGPSGQASSFEVDGGEIIFNLPNGLHAFMLIDGKGRRLDKAPTAQGCRASSAQAVPHRSVADVGSRPLSC